MTPDFFTSHLPLALPFHHCCFGHEKLLYPNLASFMESVFPRSGPPFLLPSIFPGILVFSKEGHLLMMCPK